MRDEERTCPKCGREVLAWEVPCPGCGQIPWQTPEGQRVLRSRRRRYWLRENGPIAALVIVVVIFTLLSVLARLRLFG